MQIGELVDIISSKVNIPVAVQSMYEEGMVKHVVKYAADTILVRRCALYLLPFITCVYLRNILVNLHNQTIQVIQLLLQQ